MSGIISNLAAMTLLTMGAENQISEVDVKRTTCFSIAKTGCMVRQPNGNPQDIFVFSHQRYAEEKAGGPVEVIETQHNRKFKTTVIFYVDKNEVYARRRAEQVNRMRAYQYGFQY